MDAGQVVNHLLQCTPSRSHYIRIDPSGTELRPALVQESGVWCQITRKR